MAAGLSLSEENLDTFSRAFDEEVSKHLEPDELHGVIHSDGELNIDDITMELASSLRNGGPWGQHFEEPVFDGEFEMINRRVVAEKHLKLVLQPIGSQRYIDAIAFNVTDEDWPEQVSRVEVAYRLDINEYQGRQNLQLMVDYIQPCK